MKFFLFFILVVSSFCSEFIFVVPVLKDEAKPAIFSNYQVKEFYGRNFFVFQEDKSPKAIEIEKVLFSSPLIRYVVELRQRARSLVSAKKSPFLVYCGEKLGLGGPAVASGFPMFIRGTEVYEDSLLILAPLKIREGVMQIQDFIDQKYFSTMIAHEFFHGIVGDLYQEKIFELMARSRSTNGHSSEKITDEALAFSEGMAEAMELLALEQFENEVSFKLEEPTFLSEGLREFIKRFKLQRLVVARRNKFGFVKDGQVLDGEIDKPENLFKTEGVIASLLYKILFKSNLESSMDKVLQTLASAKPMNFIEFLYEFVRVYPHDRESVLRQFLESTYYTTVNPDSAEQYKREYQAKKSFKQGKLAKDAFLMEKSAWERKKLVLYEEVIKGDLSLDSALPFAYALADEDFFYEIDLNSSPEVEIREFLDEYFQKEAPEPVSSLIMKEIMQTRVEGRFIRDMDSVQWPQDVELKMDRFHQIYKNRMQEMLEKRILQMSDHLQGYTEESSQVFFWRLHSVE